MATNGFVGAAAALVAAVATFFALYFASSVFAPVACALFIIALVWPLQDNLQAYLPRLIALAIVTLACTGVFFAFASLAAWGFGRVGRVLVGESARFQLLYEQASAWLESHGITIVGLWSEHFNMRWLLRAAQEVAGRLNTTLSFWLIVLLYLILGLLEVPDSAAKISAMKNPQTARVLLEGSVIAARKIRKYMLVRTWMSIVTGLLVWALAYLTGLQLAAEWGVIAFTLNYIPFIGPFVATLLPTLYALAQFASWQAALAIFLCLNAIQFVVGSYIEPRVAGTALAISPVIVLFSVFFWTFLWGLFGAVIGVPITIAIVAFCAQHPSSRWIADLLGMPGEGPERHNTG